MEQNNSEVSDALIYGIYSKLIQNTQYYDSHQTFLRLLTSTILLGTYAAIGFLLSLNHEFYAGNKFLLMSVLSLLSTILISSLWYIDLIITERLFLSNLIEAHKLELSHKWLPKMHSYLIKINYKDYKISKKVYFYIICASGPIAISTVTLFLTISSPADLKCFIAMIITVPSILFLYFFLISKWTKNLQNKIRLLY